MNQRKYIINQNIFNQFFIFYQKLFTWQFLTNDFSSFFFTFLSSFFSTFFYTVLALLLWFKWCLFFWVFLLKKLVQLMWSIHSTSSINVASPPAKSQSSKTVASNPLIFFINLNYFWKITLARELILETSPYIRFNLQYLRQ